MRFYGLGTYKSMEKINVDKGLVSRLSTQMSQLILRLGSTIELNDFDEWKNILTWYEVMFEWSCTLRWIECVKEKGTSMK